MKTSEVHDRASEAELKKIAGAHRSRAAQRVHKKPGKLAAEDAGAETPPQGNINDRPEMMGTNASSIEENVSGEMRDEVVQLHPELIDSEEPPPPQLRRARSTSDPARKVKDKNTGIKHRDASGRKHRPAQSGM